MQKLIPLLISVFILTGAMSSCKDDPILPPSGKCDTCAVDTTDTTDTVVVTPNDTTSHDFVWTEYSLSGEASIGGCWVFSDTEIWVAGNDLYRFKNNGWERISVVGSGTSIFGFTPTNSWFVYYDLISHYNGSTFQEFRLWEDPYNLIPPGEDGPFKAAWGTSSNDMFFVGDKGTIVHFDGMNWIKFPKVTQKDLRSVWGTSSDDVWASGYTSSTSETILLHYDGSSWQEVDISRDKGIGATGGFNSVWTVDSAGHKVTFTSGAILIKRTDNGPWRSDSGLVTNRLGDGSFAGLHKIHGNHANDVMLQGAGGWIGHWNGKSWHQYSELFHWGDPSYLIFGSHFKGNTALMVGKKSNGFVAIGKRMK